MTPTPQRLAVLGFAAILLLAFLVWRWTPESGPAFDSRASEVSAAPPDALVVAPAPMGATDRAAGVERQAAPELPAATTGSLLVHVIWGDDQQPAAGIEVLVHRPTLESLFETPRGRSDAAGSVTFEGLAPGTWYPAVLHGEDDWEDEVTIVAGQRTEITLPIKLGMNARGRVVDENSAPVADADIVVCGWGGGRTETLCQSAADGTFALRCLPQHCYIGARKEGKRPSSLREFTVGAGASVDLTIVLTGTGSSLAGLVLDPHGHPVEGAAVQAGSREQDHHVLPDGAQAMGPQRELVRTDAGGRFLFRSVVPGNLPLAVRALHLAPWRETIEVTAGRREQLTIHLQPGVTLSGTVRDANGAAVARVEITAGDPEQDGSRHATTAADGSYRLDGLPFGKLAVSAEDRKLGKVAATLDVTAGEERRWDPLLSAGLQLHGKVVDPDGKPVAKVIIEAMLERTARGERWGAFEVTDDEGRFTLNNCLEGRTLHLEFRRHIFPELIRTGVLPTEADLVVTIPKEAWIHIEGVVLGPDGEVLPSASAYVSRNQSGSGPIVTPDAKTGAFRFGPYPPGTFALRFSADGFPPLRVPERALLADEVWNVGTLRFQRGGWLAVQLVGESVPDKATLQIYREAGEYLDRFETSKGAGRSSPLAAGSYVLQIGGYASSGDGDGLASGTQAFEIRAGVETRIDVAVAVGIATTIECSVPAGVSMPRDVALVIRDAVGGLVCRSRAWSRNHGPLSANLLLRSGQYSIEAVAGELRASDRVSVTAPGPARLTVVLRRP